MTEPGARPRRRVNLLGVAMAAVFLVVAVIGLTGDPWWLIDSATKWIIAGFFALVGVGLLRGALPGRSHDRSEGRG